MSRICPKPSFRVVFLFFAITTISCVIHNASAQTPSGNAKILGPDTVVVGQEIEISIQLINPNRVNHCNIDIEYPQTVDYKSVSRANGNPTPNVQDEVSGENSRSRYFTSKLPDGEFFSAGLLFTAKFVTDIEGSHDFIIGEWQVDTGNVAGIVATGDGEITVKVTPVSSGSLAFHRRGTKPRFDVPTVFQLRLTNRTSAHHYSVTIDFFTNESEGVNMLLTDIQIVQDIWHKLDTIVRVPRTESDYRRISALRENLITLIGENENRSLTSLLEVVEALIEKYKLDRESTERETVYRLCVLMLSRAYVEDESENEFVTPKCLNPDCEEK